MHAWIRGIAVGAVVAAATASAFADGTVPRYEPNAHSLKGSLAAGEEHYVPMDLPAGTLLSLTCKADKKQKSTLQPTLTLVGPDGVDVVIAAPRIHPKKGYKAKKVPLDLTGRYVVVIEGLGGTSGAYAFKAKAKLPKVFKGELDFGAGPYEIPFPATLDAKVGLSVVGKKGQALPSGPRVVRPDGQAFGPPGQKETKTGVKAKNFVQGGELGTYTLRFQLRAGTEAGTRVFKYKISVKFPKASKAKYTYPDLIVAPHVTGFTPQELSGNNEVVNVVATGRFFQPGTEIELQLGGTVVQVGGEQRVPGGLQGVVNPFGMSPGSWDVVARSPSGGVFRLAGFVSVLPAQPRVASVSPPSVRDDTVQLTLTLSGTNLGASSEVVFRRALPGGGEEVIQPTLIQPFGAAQLNVTVNLFHRPLGFYDVEVFNRGPTPQFDSDTASTDDVLEIVNAPPSVSAFAPGCVETTDPLAVTIDGVELEAGAQVFLQHDPDHNGVVDDEVEGTNVAVDPAGFQATADFDMSGRSAGAWAVVFRNADGQEGSLADVLFTVDGLPMTLTDAALGQPDVAIDPEHDLALLVWLETDEAASGSGSTWKVMGRLLDTSTDAFAGAAFQVSDASKDGQPKRTVSAAYNLQADEWLVVWCEHTFASLVLARQFAGLTPTSGTVYQVYGRRVGTTGSLSGAEIDFVDHDQTSGSSFWSVTEWYDEFEYWNPQVVYAPWDGNWYLTVTQEYDTDSAGREDYDAYLWRVSRTNPGYDANADWALHFTPDHEGDCLTALDTDAREFFIVGACDSSAPINDDGPRQIEGKVVTSLGTVLPGSSTSGASYAITTRQTGETVDFEHPRAAYATEFAEFLVVYERVDEGGSDKKEIRGQLVTAATTSPVGNEFVIAADADHDLIRPRVVYNATLREYLVTWTVDDTDGDSLAMARHLPAGTPTNAGNAVPLGCAGSGFPVASVEPVTGEYVVLLLNGYGELGAGERTAGELLVRRVP